MNIKLYQVNMDRDEDSAAFLSLDNLRHTHPNAEVDPAIYDLVYSGDVNCKDLEEVFHLFNFDHPADFTGRSMSVSDVVETGGKFYFCDSVGFQEIAFDAGKAGKSEENKIRVVLLEPGKTAKITEIGSRLKDLQAVVGGYIEAVYPFEENVCIVCNEEGKINGLPLNRAMRDDSGAVYDAIAGTAFLCDCSGERFGSLSEEQCRRYQRQFRNPEQFVRIGNEILAIPYAKVKYNRPMLHRYCPMCSASGIKQADKPKRGIADSGYAPGRKTITMPKKKTIPDYPKILRGDTEYYRTRITDADGKRVDIYGKSCEEVYEKVQAAQKTIAEAIFRRENPTVADYCKKWLLIKN